jgi:hypothetical protein
LDAIGNAQGLVNQRNCPKQWVGFAIELETELQEATFEIERLRKANLQLREGAEQQKQRIKLLEEAGDALCENSNPSRWDSPAAAARKLTEQSNWIKAKEDKP